jgi:glutamate--cysteine ligase catalytic subunit
VPVDYDADTMNELTGAGMDAVLAKHISHLFTRDPLVIFDDAIELDNTRSLDHFENIQVWC